MEFFDNHAMANNANNNGNNNSNNANNANNANNNANNNSNNNANNNSNNANNNGTSQVNTNANNVDSCAYHSESQYDRINCNDCFQDENCRIADCGSVCNLNIVKMKIHVKHMQL